MNRIVKLVVLVPMWLLFVTSVTAMNIPKEPGQEKVLERFINPSIGAFLIVYDLDGDGEGDYMTQRDITPDFTLIAKYPSYYAVDLNGDGGVNNETELFIDVERDGLNGNEILYAKWMVAQEEAKDLEEERSES